MHCSSNASSFELIELSELFESIQLAVLGAYAFRTVTVFELCDDVVFDADFDEFNGSVA